MSRWYSERFDLPDALIIGVAFTAQALSAEQPGGDSKRENKLHVHRFSRDHDFMQQALSDRLTFFKRELFQVLAEQLAKGLSMLYHLLPMDALMPRVR